MTPRQRQHQVDRVKAVVEDWLWVLGLDAWTISLNFLDSGLEAELPELVRVMQVVANWYYLTARIDISLPAVAEVSDEKLLEIFVHECVHIHLCEMREDDQRHEERVATQLARTLIQMRKVGSGAITPVANGRQL